MTNPQPKPNQFFLDLGLIPDRQAATLEQVNDWLRLSVARGLEVIKYRVKHRCGNFYRADHWRLSHETKAVRTSFL